MNRIILLISLLLVKSVAAQQLSASDKGKLSAIQDSLFKLNWEMINNGVEPERYNANYAFIRTLVSALKTPYSYNFGFDSLKAVSIQNSPDKKFRIFSWNILNGDGSYRFYGTIQMNTRDGKLQMFPLVDFSPAINSPLDTVTSNEKWFGAQYYRIIPVTNNSDPYYTLLGWKGNTVRTTKKVIEILRFKDNKPVFGHAVFDEPGSTTKKQRIIFEYDRKATMFLQYQPSQNMIVFDHLSPPDEKLAGKFEFYGPDMSYDGFRLKNNRWQFLPDLELKNDPAALDDEYNDPVRLRGRY